MKHKSIDLQAEVNRATLPDGLHGFLFPLYEAVSNSFHSIEERWGDDLEGRDASKLISTSMLNRSLSPIMALGLTKTI